VIGDSWHRFYVRMLEVVQSMKIIRQAIEKYSRCGGEVGRPIALKMKLPRAKRIWKPKRPKGQMGFMIISDGTPVPWRTRIRSSSFSHTAVIPELCRGLLIADVPAVVGSLDVVLGEIDR